MKKLLALFVVVLATSLWSEGAWPSVPVGSSPRIWERSGEVAVGGGFHPVEAPEGNSGLEIRAGNTDSWLEFAVSPDASDDFYWDVGAPFGPEYTVLHPITLHWNVASPTSTASASFGALGTTVPPGGTHFHAWSVGLSGENYVHIPAGQAFRMWNPAGEVNYTLAFQLRAGNGTAFSDTYHLATVTAPPVGTHAAIQVVAGSNGALVRFDLLAETSTSDVVGYLLDAPLGGGYTIGATHSFTPGASAVLTSGAAVDGELPISGIAITQIDTALLHGSVAVGGAPARPWVWLPAGRALVIFSVAGSSGFTARFEMLEAGTGEPLCDLLPEPGAAMPCTLYP